MTRNTTHKEFKIDRWWWTIQYGLPGGTMDGQLTKVESIMETQKSKYGQQGAQAATPMDKS